MNFIKTVPDSSRAVFLILGVQKSGWQPSDFVVRGCQPLFLGKWYTNFLRNAANTYRKSIKSV